MQEVLIQATVDSQFQNAANHLSNRSLLYNKDTGVLYIKYNDEMHQINHVVDGENIIIRDERISLADDVVCRTLTVKPDESGLVYKDNVVFAETTDTKRIILILRINKTESLGTIGGKLYEKGTTTSGINFSASVNGSRYLDGSTTGESPKWCKCTYQGTEYLGIKFNPNNTVYFSGYDFLKDEDRINFEYNDSTFDEIIFLKEDAGQSNDVIIIDNSNSVNWDFTEYCDGLDEANNSTTPRKSYDLTNGLSINSAYTGSVSFFPKVLVKDDMGYISTSTSGKFLKFNTGDYKPYLKFLFSSGNNESVDLVVYNSNGSTFFTASSSTDGSINTAKTPIMESNKTYYIGITSNKNIKIHKITLLYSKNVIVQEGWDAFDYVWEFNRKPNDWIGNADYDWGNGLQQVFNNDGGDPWVFKPNESSNNGNYGYVQATIGLSSKIFDVIIKNDNTTLSCLFSTNTWTLFGDDTRTLHLLDEDGNVIAQLSNNNRSSPSTLSKSELKKGRYSLWASQTLRIWQVRLQNAGQQEVWGDVEDLSINNLVNTLGDLKDTGEDGDAYYIYMNDQTFSLENLKELAKSLRNSDKQLHLDLSSCNVAPDAENWEGLFQNCTSLRKLDMPQGVKTIGKDTFSGCMFLKEIGICNSVEEFNSSSTTYIFSGARVRTILLPNSLTKIGWNTFANSAVRNIVVPPDLQTPFYNTLEYGAFFDTLNYIRIYMTQAQYDSHDWSIEWEHSNFIGSGDIGSTIADHIIIYSDLTQALTESGFYED